MRDAGRAIGLVGPFLVCRHGRGCLWVGISAFLRICLEANEEIVAELIHRTRRTFEMEMIADRSGN